jgi:hypothetical protein
MFFIKMLCNRFSFLYNIWKLLEYRGEVNLMILADKTPNKGYFLVDLIFMVYVNI